MLKATPTDRHAHALSFVLALTLAFLWVYATQEMYAYNREFLTVFGLNLFPLLGWTTALTLGYAFMNWLFRRFAITQTLSQIATMILLYSAIVMVIETVGYHIFGIHNLGTSQYAGLPLCNCLHAPAWMQIGYFLLGPVHWLLARTLGHFMQLDIKSRLPL